jgi:hypothetical protein
MISEVHSLFNKEKIKPKKFGGKDSYRVEPPKEDEEKRREE